MKSWDLEHRTHRLWARDSSLWTGKDESNWMGWLRSPQDSRAHVGSLIAFADEIRKDGFKHILLLGMGGSSLCPDVLQKTFGDVAGYPSLRVLDSTDPDQIARFENELEIAKTLFIVSSKSGSTLEPNILEQYFYEKASAAIGKQVGAHFVAITDPGSELETLANQKNYRRVFYGSPTIGGRYSALSNFGMVPAALMGIDVKGLLDSAEQMSHDCAPSVAASDNPGVSLGISLGEQVLCNRDKLTFLISPKIKQLGVWLEQLIAESLGKDGKGLIPVDREPLGAIDEYGTDRVFAYIRLDGDDNNELDAFSEALKKSGQSIVVLNCAAIFDLGAEFFRWEIATAVAGSLMRVHPFDQPDVEASKIETRKLTDDYERTQHIADLDWLAEDEALKFFASDEIPFAFPKGEKHVSAIEVLRAHLSTIKPGDYFNISAFIEMNDDNDEALREIRALVRSKKHVATNHGFGPRFLHSTGQAFKGGPNTGVFLQITSQDVCDIEVPNHKLTFGLVKEMQARGDLAVLSARARRCLRVHITSDLRSGLSTLRAQIQKALQ